MLGMPSSFHSFILSPSLISIQFVSLILSCSLIHSFMHAIFDSILMWFIHSICLHSFHPITQIRSLKLLLIDWMVHWFILWPCPNLPCLVIVSACTFAWLLLPPPRPFALCWLCRHGSFTSRLSVAPSDLTCAITMLDTCHPGACFVPHRALVTAFRHVWACTLLIRSRWCPPHLDYHHLLALLSALCLLLHPFC